MVNKRINSDPKSWCFLSKLCTMLYETLYPNRIILLWLIKNVIVMTISSILQVFHVLLCPPGHGG